MLDIGCGTRVTVEFLVHEHSIWAMGIDSSSWNCVTQGRAQEVALRSLLGDAEALPFADESFEEGVLGVRTFTLFFLRLRKPSRNVIEF